MSDVDEGDECAACDCCVADCEGCACCCMLRLCSGCQRVLPMFVSLHFVQFLNLGDVFVDVFVVE